MDREKSEVSPDGIQYIQSVISRFDKDTDFAPEYIKQRGGVNYLKSDFALLTKLALVAERLDFNTDYWRNALEERRSQNKQTAFEYGDRLTALEIDEDYCFYLFDSGKVNDAIEFAQHITDGYVQPSQYEIRDAMEAIAYDIEQRQFDEKPQRILERMITRLITSGDIERVHQIMSLPIMFEYDKLGYLRGLADYSMEQQDHEQLSLIHSELRKRMAFNDDDILFRRYRAVSDSIIKYQAIKFIEDGDILAAIEKASEIEVPHVRLQTKISFIPDALTYDSQYVKKFVQEITTEIEREYAIDEINAEEVIILGKLNLQINLLLEIFDNLVPYEELADITQQCMYGTEEQRGLFDCLLRMRNPAPFAQTILTILAKNKSIDCVEEMYMELSKLFPDFSDYLTKAFALTVAEIDPVYAENSLLSIDDLEVRKNGYYKYICNMFESGRIEMSRWYEFVQNYKNLEDLYLKPEPDLFAGDFTLDDILNAPNEAEKKAERSIAFGSFAVIRGGEMFPKSKSSQIPGLLAYLAEYAGKREDWQEFTEIVSDSRMTPDKVVRVLATIVL